MTIYSALTANYLLLHDLHNAQLFGVIETKKKEKKKERVGNLRLN